MYSAYVRRAKKRRCPQCQDSDHTAAIERYDCGCMNDIHVGDYDTLPIACMVAARQCSLPGTRRGGLNTGGWHIENETGEIVSAGEQAMLRGRTP